MKKRSFLTALAACAILAAPVAAQAPAGGKPISPDLFGIFFEDINYAADGGLYAELVQNRSFEYAPGDHEGWNPLTSWEFLREGFATGSLSVESTVPLHANNPHYVQLQVETPFQKGAGLKNVGFDGIPLKAGEKYNFSMWARLKSSSAVPLLVQLRDPKGTVLAETNLSAQASEWQHLHATLAPSATEAAASLVVLATSKGVLDLDMLSLFPQKTFRNRPNGLRADLAQAIADLHPKFIRFPGGCLAHGDGLDNVYDWKKTVGPLEQRKGQRNIWNYHQTAGLGYFEYFQFCEDIGAKPLPVVAAGVSCQNSGGTWRIGSTGQQCLPIADMQAYTQDVLDLVEYANGPVSSTWGAKRAAAGHPKPFGLTYIGIGNEDKQTPEFRERFKLLYDAMRRQHPEITIIGTVGPGPKGEDYDQGWAFANQLNVPMVDEHYYETPRWFMTNNQRYDRYDRSKSKVYVGEYASWGNTLYHALAEAAYMTSLERNGDVVQLASYAPLLAKEGHTQWKTDLIYFTNTTVAPSVNYQVQQLFGQNQGDTYHASVVTLPTGATADTTVAASCVRDAKSGDIILKLVNTVATPQLFSIDLTRFPGLKTAATRTVLTGPKDAVNNFTSPKTVMPKATAYKAAKRFTYTAAPYSLTVIRVPGKR
ncbi:alpha-L-arabinofuranosidase C-terminal domain-containing protein [Hymenobacter sp. YC55]|uniref:alpha-L-arabinofuranosidase C-terminal domain-containing protein n=1 Tax=Hymenobacter sp. YC55 TaxID=3034019 RepID=UPI0023F7A2A0|nr:alpha-L-arabinofuranosidase C-terminal domain-containing protein [Hymenobacter sp. YC55]MDF7814916.1 alpha-L-arabinofuranosidase C-terminal domain-containing protein [Hymenobacter sp. YC55]